MLTRRDFLKGSSLVALAPSVPAFLAQTAHAAESAKDDRLLVVIQLDGGNDGINTVVPYADEGYARSRRKLRIATDQLIKINDQVGLHPSLRDAAQLLESGRLAIVQGVGYPNPNRSHDVSMAIWQTARFDREDHMGYGWIGRALDDVQRPAAGAPDSILLGNENLPAALRGRKSITSALAHLDDLVLTDSSVAPPSIGRDATGNDLTAFVRRSALDAYTTAERFKDVAHAAGNDGQYPSTKLADRLRLIARLIKANFGTRVYYAIQSGYDTHYLQLPAHADLLRELCGALKAFLDNLASSSVADRVLVLCFSEFGRRVEENASLGTDHGTAGPVFLAGPDVNAGLHGATPSLTDLADGDVKMSVDFRHVYATVLEKWLGIPAKSALSGNSEHLPLFRS
ncbi:MAG: DUF1501 domain-containing protein [Planctomycetes bacterium]|nr:DUF1501 domain-containing protein [Planctomycetota bacterium]